MQSVIIISIMLTGVGVGWLLRKYKVESYRKYLGGAISMVVFVLLFILGFDIGDNQTLMAGLHSLGVEALIVTLGAVLGSVLCAWMVYRLFFKSGTKQ